SARSATAGAGVSGRQMSGLLLAHWITAATSSGSTAGSVTTSVSACSARQSQTDQPARITPATPRPIATVTRPMPSPIVSSPVADSALVVSGRVSQRTAGQDGDQRWKPAGADAPAAATAATAAPVVGAVL